MLLVTAASSSSTIPYTGWKSHCGVRSAQRAEYLLSGAYLSSMLTGGTPKKSSFVINLASTDRTLYSDGLNNLKRSQKTVCLEGMVIAKSCRSSTVFADEV